VPFPRSIARFNRFVTNPVLSLIAGRVGPFGMLEHVGRKSGKPRKTPIMLFREPTGYVIALTYGPRTDWVANVRSAGRCVVTVHRERIELVDPQLIEGDPASFDFPAPVIFFLHRMRVRYFLRLVGP
jgi:deazaflavin-dependent oxidoreductase (nitroreductase family)